MTHIAKLFKIGRSQAVRLPAGFRFAEKQVYIRRDPVTGDVVLSRRPHTWHEYFRLIARLDIPQDFLAGRGAGLPQVREGL